MNFEIDSFSFGLGILFSFAVAYVVEVIFSFVRFLIKRYKSRGGKSGNDINSTK